MGVTELVVVVELQKVRTKCISSDFWDRTGGEFKNGMYTEGRRKQWKNPFLQNLYCVSRLGRNVIKIALEWR